jgi:hypothetical protein
VANNKRSYSVSVLLLKVLLYSADANDVIEKRLLNDLFWKVDAVIIAGTPLKCKLVKVLARELYRAAKWNNGLTMWVNKRRLDLEFKSLLDYVVEGDYNEFASALLVQDV